VPTPLLALLTVLTVMGIGTGAAELTRRPDDDRTLRLVIGAGLSLVVLSLTGVAYSITLGVLTTATT
jgi:hypothetical protein